MHQGCAKAFWVTGPRSGELRVETLTAPADGEALIEARFSGISRGTELLVYRNRVPPSQYRTMRCPFQAGHFPAPVKYGYSLVGRVRQGPPSLVDKEVFVLAPHQDWLVVPADAAVPIPPQVPSARAVLAANMETALNALWDSKVAAGDRVAVLGAGVVGLLIAFLAARIPAVEATIIDPDPAKAAAASALAVPFAIASPDEGDYDLVFEASGHASALPAALALAGWEATVVVVSWYGAATVPLPLGEAFHARRLTLRSSQVGGLPPSQGPGWSHRRRLETAIRLLADDRLDDLISGESDFAALPDVMAGLDQGLLAALCHRIRY
jgi:2-desacetyl-2-hydroxyethyl bacteriochlorophyllide A dehydrogenase